jgi:hypothetical protein
MWPSDFQIYGPRKKHLAGKRFAADGDVKQAVASCLQALDSDFFYGGMQASKVRQMLDCHW